MSFFEIPWRIEINLISPPPLEIDPSLHFEHHQADASAHILDHFQVSLSEDKRLAI